MTSKVGVPETFEITGVDGRTIIRIHHGNTTDDTDGCPLLGKYLGWFKDKRFIYDSVRTLKAFMNRMKGKDEFVLEVVNASINTDKGA